MKLYIKKIIERLPYSLSKHLAQVPLSVLLGNEYNYFSELLNKNQGIQLDYAIDKFEKIFQYAKNNIPFYKKLYIDAGVYNMKISNIEDIKKIPIITKEDIRRHQSEFRGYAITNTGGSSGEPFSFYIDKNAYAREWAHIHYIWGLKGYNREKIKITLRGKNIGEDFIKYNAINNEFLINTYKDSRPFKRQILNLIIKHKIEYVHGYPSSIYNFFNELDSVLTINEKKEMNDNLKVCFLGSEYPAEYITEYLSSKWELDYISWYGHSEMCILAYDYQKNGQYVPFYTYGFPEIVNNKLVGTSFHNFDMPLIRYDTGDIAEPILRTDGLLLKFIISIGREGEYIIDNKNKKIPLTALVYGRHHKVFNYAKFIQVHQDTSKKVTFFIVTSERNKSKLMDDMDLKNININYDIEILDKPVRTNAGKVVLKI